MTLAGSFGLDGFGSSPFGSTPLPLGVLSAQALNVQLVRVNFTDLLDFADPAVLSPSNYTILGASSPLVTAVLIDSAYSVRLVTTVQSYINYDLLVTSARSLTGSLLSPAQSTVSFTGFPVISSYTALGVAGTRIRLFFTLPMLMDAAYSDPASYQVLDSQGSVLTVLSVGPEQWTDEYSVVHSRSVILTLSAPGMLSSQWYRTVLVGALLTEGGLTPEPAESSFQFLQSTSSFSLSLSDFSGEVSGGLYGTPAGLVFFSPALVTSIPNSVIQVNEVEVCTTAYDEYHFPVPVDPSPFYTWSPSSAPKTMLGQSGISLWAPFPRLSEARFDLTFTGAQMVESVTAPVDNSCTWVLQELWDRHYVALLNNPAWSLFDQNTIRDPAPIRVHHALTASLDARAHFWPEASSAEILAGSGVTADLSVVGVETVPPMFICANNLAPIPAGPQLMTVLWVGLPGMSHVQATAKRTVWLSLTVAGGSDLIGP